MNLCVLIGVVISNIEFNFIINSKNISIASFYIQLENKSIIKVKAYNELADKCYSQLLKNDVIAIIGKLNSNYEIIINELNIL